MHILSTLCSDQLPTPVYDYLDPTPACDGSFVTEASIPCVISTRDDNDDEKESTSSFLLYPITPPMTRAMFDACYVKMEDYQESPDGGRISSSSLDQVIETIRNIVHNEWKECVTGKVLLYIVIAETLCAWLSAKRLWYIYSPVNEPQFKYSMPKYVFRLPPNVGAVSEKQNKKDKKENLASPSSSSHRLSLQSMTLYEACQKVYVEVTGKPSDHLKSLLTRNIRQTLHHMRCKEILLKENGVFHQPKKTKYHVHNAKMAIYILRGNSPTSHENTIYSHLTLSPYTGVFDRLLCTIKQCASMVIPYTVLCDYIKEQKTNAAGSSGGGSRKRKHGSDVAIDGGDKELKRVRDEFHSDTIVYYKYTSCIRNGALLCAAAAAASSSSWDLTPLGIDELYWNWIKETDSITSTYADPDTHRLRSGPRLVAANISTEECCVLMEPYIVLPPEYDVSLTLQSWYLHSSLEIYAGVFIAPLIEHEIFHHHKCDDAVCMISCYEALSLLCMTMSEVYKCMISLWPDLELSTLQQHYKTVKKDRLATLHIAAQQWLSAPSSKDASILYEAAQNLLDQDHETPSEESIKSARRRVCLNLAYPVYGYEMYKQQRLVTVQDRKDSMEFKSIDAFLVYCMQLINRHLLFPLVRCWSYIHPPALLADTTDTRSYALTQIHNSITTHTQSPSFLTAIDAMIVNTEKTTERLHACEFDRDMLSLLLIALRYNSPTSDALIAKIETLLISVDRAGDTHINTMLDTARKEIRGMLTHRLIVDNNVILDVARQMSRLDPLLDQRLYISGWLLETVREDPAKYTPAMIEFKSHVEKYERDALLLGIAKRINVKA